MCASGMKSVMFGAQSIMLQQRQVVLAGGFESMTNAPYLLPSGRFGARLGNALVEDAVMKDGLSDAYDGKAMGFSADLCSKTYNISREEQDKYSLESYKRSAETTKNGMFKDELFSIAVTSKTGTTYVTEDEEFNNLKVDKVSTLKPAFEKDGTVTVVSSSKISDGAACLMLMSEEKAKRAGLRPIARILGFGDAEKAPSEFTTAPSLAIPVALKQAGLTKEKVDLFEINEAFAVVPLVNMRLLGLDHSKVNVFGGAVALGHPIGASGARIIVTLINALKKKNGTIGVASICNGGGGASAIVIENL